MKTYTIDEAKAALKDGALLEGYLNETGREIHAGSMIRCPNHSAHENDDASRAHVSTGRVTPTSIASAAIKIGT